MTVWNDCIQYTMVPFSPHNCIMHANSQSYDRKVHNIFVLFTSASLSCGCVGGCNGTYYCIALSVMSY